MAPQPDPLTELMQTVFVLRPEIRFVPQIEGQRTHFIIEDPLNSKYYRIGASEYELISLLNGKRTLSEALQVLQIADNASHLTEDATQTIGRWLLQSELATSKSESQVQRQTFISKALQSGPRWSRFNPISIKIPVLRPERVFAGVTPALNWLFSAPAFLGWLCTVGIALFVFAQQFDTFSSQTRGILAVDNWFWLGISWVFLKLIHESAHGLACKRFGGTVREAGIILILFAPLAYVDVTSSLRFRSRWHRIVTAGAGIYAELFVAAIALLVWNISEPGVLKHVCHNVVTMASITTLVFNANPLMRFDGYYILSDALGIPNLYTNGQAFVQHLGRKYLLGLPSSFVRRKHQVIIKCYGIAAFFWRITVSLSLILAASTMFDGAGVALSAVAIALSLGRPIFNALKNARAPSTGPKANWLRCAMVVGSVAAPLAVALLTIPWPAPVRAPAVVEFSPLTVVRAASPGFVADIYVESGQYVQAGTVLARLVNPQLQADLADLDLEIQQSLLRSRSYEHHTQLAAYQAESEKRRSLEKKMAEKQEQVDSLVLTAPVDGHVIGRQLESRVATYLKQGTELFAIGGREKELKLAIAQNDIDFFNARVGEQVRLRLPGLQPVMCTLKKVEPRASLRPPHASLCASTGGPLPVRQATDETSDDVEFTSPRFTGSAVFPHEQSVRATAGQVGVIGLGWHGRAVGPHLHGIVKQWIRTKLQKPTI